MRHVLIDNHIVAGYNLARYQHLPRSALMAPNMILDDKSQQSLVSTVVELTTLAQIDALQEMRKFLYTLFGASTMGFLIGILLGHHSILFIEFYGGGVLIILGFCTMLTFNIHHPTDYSSRVEAILTREVERSAKRAVVSRQR